MVNYTVNIDHHVYFDPSYYDIKSLKKLLKKNYINQAILSPSCTKIHEPEKSEYMYYFQQQLLSNSLGFIFCKNISKSFYNENGELRFFWKIFSKNEDLKKVINPNNSLLYNKIKKEKNLKLWYWINPKINTLSEVTKNINKFSDKVYGIKFHQYWHEFNIREIQPYLEMAETKSLPIYIILHYEDPNKIYDLLNKNKNIKFIFGYGCFPLYFRIWHKLNRFENCYIDTASNHLSIKLLQGIFHNFENNRILFSSDCPYNFKDDDYEFSYDKFLKRLDWLSVSDKKKFLEQSI